MPTLILRFLSTKTIAALAFSALAFSALACFTLTLAMVPLSSIAQTAKAPQVSMKTSMGEIIIELYPDKAPKSVENFLSYVKDGHYTGTIFHRVIDNFMIQGGGFTRDLKQKKTKAPIQIESQNGLKNDIGWVAMARTSQPDSATAQFFINTVENRSLDFPAPDGFGYTVFGKVVKGMNVVEKIRKVDIITVGTLGDVPVSPIIIDSVTLIPNK
jgi:peptidyl-prolyl cis-trans isomerase A (cyclophilin A)